MLGRGQINDVKKYKCNGPGGFHPALEAAVIGSC